MKKFLPTLTALVFFYLMIEHTNSVLKTVETYPEAYLAGIFSIMLKPLLERIFGS